MSSGRIEFRNVTKRFYGSDGSVQTVLDEVSFVLQPGKTTVIAGGSGQGKSVTLKLILGLLPADSGQILVDGVNVVGIGGRALEKLRLNFGVLFQSVALFDSMSVYDNIALPLRERTSFSEPEIRERVHVALESLELAGHEEKYPAQLSGGMQKRVGLARALQLNPTIMLFDEPTTGLDPVMSQEIYELFARTQREKGFTSVLVSHDIPRVLGLADQVVLLEKGKVDLFESPEAIQWSRKEHVRNFVVTTMGEIYQSGQVEL